LDALMVKIREAGQVRNNAIYVVIGVNMDGNKGVLGLWAGLSGNNAEGAKFWLQVLTELKNRGVMDVFIACVDGLKGFPEAIEAVYPQTSVQTATTLLGPSSERFAELCFVETEERGGGGS